MSLASAVVGVILLALAAFFVLGREWILARGRDRSGGRPSGSPMALLVLGAVLGLAGGVQLVLAFR
jgi:hypothetical protein